MFIRRAFQKIIRKKPIVYQAILINTCSRSQFTNPRAFPLYDHWTCGNPVIFIKQDCLWIHLGTHNYPAIIPADALEAIDTHTHTNKTQKQDYLHIFFLYKCMYTIYRSGSGPYIKLQVGPLGETPTSKCNICDIYKKSD